MATELYVSVDVEADGPIPGPFSMLSMGMSVVGHPEWTWYAELRPISDQFDPQALEVCGLDRERLKREGLPPEQALRNAAAWLKTVEGSFATKTGHPHRCVFLAAPAVWDGMFVHWYFIRFLGHNPFGVTGSGIDLRSYWMGVENSTWYTSSKRHIAKRVGMDRIPHTHRADDDAKEQAAYFEGVLAYQKRRREESEELNRGQQQVQTLEKRIRDQEKLITKYKGRTFVGVSIIVRRGDLVIMGKRKGKHGDGTYAFVGGAEEATEEPIDAAVRELLEETGIEVKASDLTYVDFVTTYHPEAKTRWLTVYYETRVPDGIEPKLVEPDKCEGWGWYHRDDLPRPLFMPDEVLRRLGSRI